MNPNVEQMTLFDFLGDLTEPTEITAPPMVVKTPEATASPARKPYMGIEVAPRDFGGITIGSVCEIIAEDPRKEQLPHLFTKTEIGKRVIVSQLSIDRGARWVWAYEAKPRRYKTTSKGKKICEYDPSCMIAPYPAERLLLLDQSTADLTMKLIAD